MFKTCAFSCKICVYSRHFFLWKHTTWTTAEHWNSFLGALWIHKNVFHLHLQFSYIYHSVQILLLSNVLSSYMHLHLTCFLYIFNINMRLLECCVFLINCIALSLKSAVLKTIVADTLPSKIVYYQHSFFSWNLLNFIELFPVLFYNMILQPLGFKICLL